MTQRAMIVAAAIVMGLVGVALAAEEAERVNRDWEVVGKRSVLDDAAVAVGTRELKAALRHIGVALTTVEQRTPDANAFVLSVRPLALDMPRGLSTQDAQFVSESAYAIGVETGPARSLSITAGAPLGLAYGLCHVADRIRVLGAVPEVSKTVLPALPYRFGVARSPVASSLSGPDPSDDQLLAAQKAFEKHAADTVNYGYNFIIIPGTEDYVPWRASGYPARSERYRKYLQRFIKVAHTYHLRLLIIGDEFIYLPKHLERFEATLSVKDDRLWRALRSKYSDLLAAFPELDGVATRIGELIPKYDFRGLDLIHAPESEPDPRIEERYRRFIKTMHDVVVGEFGKFYLHRTWVVNVHEQHSIPQVYARTFTQDVPAKNLFIAIKLTAGDQWYHYEPYNATFGATGHTTIAQGELYSGYQGGGTYIDFPARYFQAALEWAADRGAKGILNGLASGGLTHDAILYVFSRLGWEPRASVKALTEDWAAATFGRQVRQKIAEIFLLGSVAVRDGLYLRQPGLHNWNPIPHVRTSMFVLEGDPLWDKGRAHDRFLKDIYLECKPWFDQTLSELNHGVQTSERMWAIFEQCKHQIEDPEKTKMLEHLLRHGRAAIQLNRDYVESFLTYFRYRERPTSKHKALLVSALDRLKGSVAAYERSFDYYKLLGITEFVDLAERAVRDLAEAERILRQAPTREQTLAMFAQAEVESKRLLREQRDAALIATWEGTIDGKDLLMIQGDRFRIEHLADDPISSASLKRHKEIPAGRPCKIVVKPIEVRGTVYVCKQPGTENNNTITLYLEDPLPGQAVFRFELYAVSE